MITSAPPCFTTAAQNLYPFGTILEKLLHHLLPMIDQNETFGVKNVCYAINFFLWRSRFMTGYQKDKDKKRS